ncbi:Nif3-like dinuclear metal center hexameric protein [Paenibacillus sp. FSL M8-0334]|uniref:Nif3-like dinuclear metal center hexameric protein n=1 Tax=Paenibacillus sp. FSL M8-0334 TaxID=2921623 RepID=UPI0030FB243B
MNYTVAHIIRRLTEPADISQLEVDRLLFGHSDMVVHGVAVTFMASYGAIREARNAGANLILSHEGPFYSHRHAEPIEEESGYNSVRDMKLELISGGEIAIFRFHDIPHRYNPDLITQALLQAVQWDHYSVRYSPYAAIVRLPEPLTVQAIGEEVKQKLNLPYVRLVGRRPMRCSTIAVSVGYRGGSDQTIPLYEQDQVDLVITGEGPEWETPEYIRDALDQGKERALLLLGHCASEEPGMRRTAALIRDAFPELPVHFIAMRPLIEII